MTQLIIESYVPQDRRAANVWLLAARRGDAEYSRRMLFDIGRLFYGSVG